MDRVATDVDCNPQFLLVDGEPTRRSDLIREPTIANEANVRNWISTLKAMETFDQNSVLRVMEKVSGDQHWSVRQAALEFLTDVLQVAPPAPIALFEVANHYYDNGPRGPRVDQRQTFGRVETNGGF